MSRQGHTIEHEGARVLVTLKDGTMFIDVFVCRPKHRRWVEFKTAGRVPMSKMKNVARCPANATTKTLGCN